MAKTRDEVSNLVDGIPVEMLGKGQQLIEGLLEPLKGEEADLRKEFLRRQRELMRLEHGPSPKRDSISWEMSMRSFLYQLVQLLPKKLSDESIAPLQALLSDRDAEIFRLHEEVDRIHGRLLNLSRKHWRNL